MFLEATTNNIRRRIAIVGTVLIVAPVLTLGLVAWAFMQRPQQPWPVVEARRPSSANLTHITRDLADICRSYHRESIDKLKSGETILAAAGPVRLAGNQTAIWNAKNEVTGEMKAVQLPLMMAGETQFVPVLDFDQIAPVVDEIARVEGTPATIFQRMNEHGDMLRISSSAKSEAGTRAIGSYVPAESSESDAGKALHEVLSDKPYIGKEMQENVSYLTAYQPLKNKAGYVVGMLHTALPETQLATKVRNVAAANTNGGHNELFILEATGEARGTPLVMGDQTDDGNRWWNEKDASGQPYVQELCSRAIKLASGQVAEFRYQRAPHAGTLPSTMIARFTYVPELDWVVGFAQPDTDVLAETPLAFGLAPWTLWLLIGVGAASSGLAVRIWIKFADDVGVKLNATLDHLKKDAKQIAATAAALSQEADRTASGTSAVKSGSLIAPRADETFYKATQMIEEIRLALEHIDASSQSMAGIIGAIDQITFATNLLMVNAAIQSSDSAGEGGPISGVADELRSLTEQCRKAARITKSEIEQSRIELEKGNRDVLQLVTDLRRDRTKARQSADEGALLIQRQAEALLQLTQSMKQTVEVITTDLGVELS